MLTILLSIVMLIPDMADDPLSAQRQETAKGLVKLLAAGDFEGAVQTFDDPMKKGLPAVKLEQVWKKSVIGQYGSLKQASETRTEKQDPYHIVFVTAQFERGKLDVKVVFSDEGTITGLFFVPSEYQPPSYVDPVSFEELEVTVGKGFWALPGLISLPKGEGQFPGVVLVHGSGPQDMDSTLGPNKPHRDLAHGLASKGIAVLRYEKRTKHHQLKMALFSNNVTVKEEVIDDAVLAVNLLATHDRIDRERIFVLGHSFGGSLLPRIVRASDKIAGLISLAGSTRPLEDSILAQTKYLAAFDGKTTEGEEQVIEQLKKQVAAVKSPALEIDTSKADLPLSIPASYWLDLKNYDAAEAAKEIHKPMLFLQGGRDYQVPKIDAAN